jgi:hypothetical protein
LELGIDEAIQKPSIVSTDARARKRKRGEEKQKKKTGYLKKENGKR